MKTTKLFFLAMALMVFIAARAEDKEVLIQTNAQCEMCKERIEKALAFEKGVKEVELDMKTKKCRIVYNDTKTNPTNLRLAISKTGYKADDVKADKKACEKLPNCCKEGGVCE